MYRVPGERLVRLVPVEEGIVEVDRISSEEIKDKLVR
jgi:hypothetical protein